MSGAPTGVENMAGGLSQCMGEHGRGLKCCQKIPVMEFI